jgi:8-oxo-dGTP diphosphatase
MNQRFLVAVVFVIERDGHVLLLRRAASRDHAPGEWEPGSGRVQAGEEPAGAVVREAREETGLDIEILGPIDTFHYYRGPARDEAIGIVFHCRAVGGSLILSAEHDAARWVSMAELAEADVAEAFRRSLALVARRPA